MPSGYLEGSGSDNFLNFCFINTIALVILELVFKVIEAFENEDEPQQDFKMSLNILNFYTAAEKCPTNVFI